MPASRIVCRSDDERDAKAPAGNASRQRSATSEPRSTRFRVDPSPKRRVGCENDAGRRMDNVVKLEKASATKTGNTPRGQGQRRRRRSRTALVLGGGGFT